VLFLLLGAAEGHRCARFFGRRRRGHRHRRRSFGDSGLAFGAGSMLGIELGVHAGHLVLELGDFRCLGREHFGHAVALAATALASAAA
jgi:hypothetical protein